MRHYCICADILEQSELKVCGSEKNDAWSVFHSPRYIIVTSIVNYVPATSLET